MRILAASFLMLTVFGVAAVSLAQDEVPAELQNAGFEEPAILSGAEPGANPDKWFYFSSKDGSTAGITDRKKRSGSQSFFFKGQKDKDTFHGIAQKIAATAGERYQFMVYAINDSSEPMVGESYCQISIEWQDSEHKEVGRTLGQQWNFSLSAMRWEPFSIDEVAPESAAYGLGVVTYYSRNSEGSGMCYLDDARMSVRRVE